MTVAAIPTRPLTPDEADALAAQEAVIARHINSFREVGYALITIRDGKLYRSEYGTFEDYCRQRWDISPRHGLRLVAAAEVLTNLESGPTGPLLPASERQARPLTQLTPDQQSPAWQRVVETAPPSGITAAHVAQTVEYFRPAPPSPFRAAVAQAVVEDGTYREHVVMEQYYAVTQRLLAAAQAGRDMVRHVDPSEVAALLTADDSKTFTYVAPLLEWLQRVQDARQQGATIRRIK